MTLSSLFRRLCAAALSLAVAQPALAGDASHFTVTDTVVAPKPSGLTATIDWIGNGARFAAWGGFEPLSLRNRVIARGDAPDRIITDFAQGTLHDSLREGAFDGAEVEIYRLVEGKLTLIRRDRVKKNGHAASDWERLTAPHLMLDPKIRSVAYNWDGWARPDAVKWFAVRAISSRGGLSAPSNAVSAKSPPRISRARTEADEIPTVKLDPRAAEPGAPRNLRVRMLADGRAELSWDAPAEGRPAGYALVHAYAPPEAHRGYHFELEGGRSKPGIKTGDMVFLRKQLPQLSRAAVMSDRMWETHLRHMISGHGVRLFSDENPMRRAMLIPHAPDSPVTEGGSTFLRMVLADDQAEKIYTHSFSNPEKGQSYYPALKPGRWTVEVWVRAQTPTQLFFEVFGRRDVRPHQIIAGPKWRRYVGEFVIPSAEGVKGVGGFALVVPGRSRVDIDNFRVYRSDAPWMGLSPTDRTRLKEAGAWALRTHRYVKTGNLTYSLDMLTDKGWGDQPLPYMLEAFASAGANPWLQIEPHFSPDEWQGLVEYLAAPAGAGIWANRRAAQGREAPWTDAFEKIYIEVGNETWNGIMKPWTFEGMPDHPSGRVMHNGEIYGQFQELAIQQMKRSIWWRRLEGKVEFVLGGFAAGGGGFSHAAARGSPSSRHVTFASYLGGWDVGEGAAAEDPATYRNLLNNAEQLMARFAAENMGGLRLVEAQRGAKVKLGTYEGGPGYALNGLNGHKVTPEEDQAQERVMKSQASGVATLDSWLFLARNGFDLQNYFTFGEGPRWKSHSRWHAGGHAFPAWKLLGLWSREGRGEMLDVRTEAAPTRALKATGLRLDLPEAPQTAVYAAKDGDRLTVYLISRRLKGCGPFRVDLPIKGAASVTLHRMAGDPTDHNVYADDVKLERVELPVPANPARLTVGPETGGKRCGMPPGSALVYIYDGVTW